MPEQVEFDYIIIGAGSAGCVLAGKLSASGEFEVLLLEAGPPDRNLMIHIPAGVYSAYRNPKINWNYASAAEPALNGRSIWTPRGKVLGGSSSINSMVYMRGHPSNYDGWARDFDLPAWKFENCLPYFRAGETSDRGADSWRGDSGPLQVSKSRHQSPLIDAFLEAGAETGQGQSEDLNGYRPEGLSRLDATIGNGQRCSAAVAYLKPARGRRNLTVQTGAAVRHVGVSGNRANEVHYQKRGVACTARARREVILSGGAINSPQILLRSGIGPEDHLQAVGIATKVRLSGVGRNLQDHPTMVLQFASRKAFEMHGLNNPLQKIGAGWNWMTRREGIATSHIWEAGGLVRSHDNADLPDIQYHFSPTGFAEKGNSFRVTQGFSFHIDLLYPRSRGRVELDPGDHFGKPVIRFNYMDDAADLTGIMNGVKQARAVTQAPAFTGLNGGETGAMARARTDDEIKSVIMNECATDYHPSCSCRMGYDDDAVVDEWGRVHGVEGLRVVDASIMPRIIGGNLNGPTQMMASRIADHILGKQQLAPTRARFSFQ
ncbi:GMC family oxidoreductase [Alphaproteobacteria bacterium LSUCC0719]